LIPINTTDIPIELLVNDALGIAMDLSGAATKKIAYILPPGGITEKDAAFVTDGTDGLIKITTSGTIVFNVDGSIPFYAVIDGVASTPFSFMFVDPAKY